MLAAADPFGALQSATIPTIVMLALGFLLMIGCHPAGRRRGRGTWPKGYIYAAMALLGADRGG